MKLISTQTYKHTIETAPEDDTGAVTFVLKRLTNRQVNNINDHNVKMTSTDNKSGLNSGKVMTGTTDGMKVDCSVVGWENVFDEQGAPEEFTKAKLQLLPAKISRQLVEHIDKENGLIVTEQDKESEKN